MISKVQQQQKREIRQILLLFKLVAKILKKYSVSDYKSLIYELLIYESLIYESLIYELLIYYTSLQY